MIKNIVILVGSSFAFDVLFGMVLISKPELFSSIKKKIPETNMRFVYKLIFFSVIALIIVGIERYFDINDMVAAVILGFSVSLSGIIFSKHKKIAKK